MWDITVAMGGTLRASEEKRGYTIGETPNITGCRRAMPNSGFKEKRVIQRYILISSGPRSAANIKFVRAAAEAW